MPKTMTGNEIRESFINYFESKEHRRVKSSNLVPAADPTLLFTNAGMVPFKDVFLGVEKRPYSRAVSSQKCLRVSGKHNDLEEVGRTTRHNTFFEMLGNFSFGDYFKQEAIEYAWEYLTETLKIPKEKLWATVYEKDDEAAKLWPSVTGIPQERVVAMGEKDNFWSMGATGPCGPCSEIHIDLGEERGCGKPDCGPACDCGRYEELWNLVFMQYNRLDSGEMEPLPKPNIDTGMGLERLASLIQGVQSNFDCDLIRPLIARAEEVLEKPYGLTKDDDVSLRVIGDHVRTAAFLITEGILPSNDDRGYVLRRIMRRAMRHGKMLGAKEPFLYKVVGSVIDLFKGAYPELREAEPTMAKIIKVEEQRFGKTLEAGIGLLDGIIEKTKAKNKSSVDGREIFKLYDTYGFPLDLAIDVISDAGLGFDKNEFESEMESQRTKARSSQKTTHAEIPEVYKSLKHIETSFVGFEELEAETKIVAIIKGDSKAETAGKGEKVEVVVETTPFYAESGGQVGDIGLITTETGSARVEATKKIPPSLYWHSVEVTDGELKAGQAATAKVDKDERSDTERHHSATHLLQSALKQLLGEHVKQSGSLVEGSRLRFDFSHYAAMTTDEIREVEEIVNHKIREDIPVSVREMDQEEAIESGATALFGEKYGAKVRVVDMSDFSRELCGGTHVSSTGQIAIFKIISETGIAAGIRRIEAITGRKAFDYLLELETKLGEVAELVKCQPEESPARVQKLVDENRELKKNIKKIKSEKARGDGGQSGEEREVNGVKVVAKLFDDLDTESLRQQVDEIKNKMGTVVVLAASAHEGKVALVAGVTKDLTKLLHAGKIVKEAAVCVGGGGGGRPDMAQAGGSKVDGIGDALKSVFTSVEKQTASG